MFACPLETGFPSVASLLPNPPTGTTIFRYDEALGSFVQNESDGVNWQDPEMPMHAGNGGLIYNPGEAFTWTLRGTVAGSPEPAIARLHGAGMHVATEMRIHNGYLYFSSELVVYRQMLLRGQLIPQGKPDVIVIDHHPLQWHNAKSIAFDNKGGMYVTFSAPTNVCEDFNSSAQNSTANVKGEYPCSQLYDQAGIWKFEEDKFGQTQTASKWS